MRFLRMATNSLLAGALGAAYLTVLLLQLNPHVPILSATTWAWFGAYALFYGIHLAVAAYLLLVAREFFALDAFSPGWISVRVLAWCAAVLSGTAAALMWLNEGALAATLTATASRRMTIGAAAATAASVVLFGIAAAHYSFGRRGSRVGATLFALAVFASLALPLAARGPGRADDGGELVALEGHGGAAPGNGPRVLMILLDGASLDYIWPRAVEGRLPNFRRLLEEGASLSLATTRPTQPGPVWAAIATGMYPARTGVRAAATYFAPGDERGIDLLPNHVLSHVLTHFGFVREEPRTSATWRVRPIWSILGRAGWSVGLVRWPLTHPAPDVPGFVVSDRYHELGESISEITRAVHPRGILPALHRLPSSAPGLAEAFADEAGAPARSALSRDALYGEIARALDEQHRPRFLALRLTGLDTVGHHYFHRAAAPGPREAADEERRRQAQVLERYHAYVDEQVGAVMARLEEGDLLVVVSGFGMQHLDPLKRVVGRVLGGSNHTGTHERAPDGFLLAYGTAAAPGSHPRGAIVDVVPTLLYFFGLPVARDMDGYARTDLFTRQFTAERPIVFIPSYSR